MMKRDLLSALKISLGYLLIFLTGKLLSHNPGLPFWQWILDTSPVSHTYLFGWLIIQNRMLYLVLISVGPVLYGMRRFGWVTLAGVAIGLPLGEFLGRCSVPYLHYGWAIFAGIFLTSCIMGILLQRFSAKDISLHSRRFWIWLAVYVLLILGTIYYVRMNMP